MSTRFDLEYPYNTKWTYGYIVVNGENRKHVILSGKEKLSSTSYARYTLATALGRFLEPHEQVDHIDHDKTNDKLENLQILTVLENARKKAKHKGRLVAYIKCPVCHETFIRRTGNTQVVKCNEGRVACCSKQCNNEFRKLRISNKVRKQISHDTILNVCRVYE
jgi:hypothetical protein